MCNTCDVLIACNFHTGKIFSVWKEQPLKISLLYIGYIPEFTVGNVIKHKCTNVVIWASCYLLENVFAQMYQVRKWEKKGGHKKLLKFANLH